MPKRVILSLCALMLATSLAACGDTWRGAKQDTGENLNKSGQAIDRAGDRVRP
jgi:predicted small secreted protein